MSSNLPDGVTESMIPGNRPQDMEAQRYAENLIDDDLVGYIEENCEGDLYYECSDGSWEVESGPAGIFGEYGEAISFPAKYDCIALLLCERWDWIEQMLIERHLEDEADRAYDVMGDY